MKKFLLIVALLFAFSVQISLVAQTRKGEKMAVTEDIVLPELNVVNNTLVVKNAPAGAKVEIISIVGNKIREIEVKSGEGTYELNLPRAIYIFKLEGVVRKFVIR